MSKWKKELEAITTRKGIPLVKLISLTAQVGGITKEEAESHIKLQSMIESEHGLTVHNGEHVEKGFAWSCLNELREV